MPKVTDNIFLLVIAAMLGVFLLAVSFVYFYIRYQRRMLLQKEAMQKAELEHREGLLFAAIESQEEERTRIGRDLHDDVGSALSNLRMVMGQIISTNEQVAQSEAAHTYKPLIDSIISNVRTISHSLSPPGLDLFGLEHTLHELCDTVNSAGILRMTMENSAGDQLDRMSKQNSLALYRVTQELLNNTIRHANAANVRMFFATDGDVLSWSYEDDGKGMEIVPGRKTGMGMQNIESRLSMVNAAYIIIAAPGKGFKIEIKLPLKQTM